MRKALYEIDHHSCVARNLSSNQINLNIDRMAVCLHADYAIETGFVEGNIYTPAYLLVTPKKANKLGGLDKAIQEIAKENNLPLKARTLF